LISSDIGDASHPGQRAADPLAHRRSFGCRWRGESGSPILEITAGGACALGRRRGEETVVQTDPGGASEAQPAGGGDCLAVVGETLVDLMPAAEPGAPIPHLGGSPANVAVGLARLGRPACLVTQTGSDAHGRFARARLAAEGVRVLEAGPGGPASTARVTLDDHGRARYTFDVRWEITGAQLPAGCAAVHVGSLGLVLEPGCAEVMRLLTGAAGHRLVSLDPNIRADLLADPAAGRQHIRRAAGLADVVKLSDEDLDFLFPGAKPRQAGDLLLGDARTGDARTGDARRTRLVVVTMGGDGAFAAAAGCRVDVPAFGVAVADTVGAGDAFMSGLLAGLAGLRMLSAQGLAALGAAPERVRRLVAQAAAAAAITCGRTGADPPDAAELREFLAARL
jgi:fructokinase